MTERFTDLELARCAERELQYRRRVYAHLRVSGKMRQEDSDREIAMMEAIANRLARLAELEPEENGLLL